VVRDRLDAVRVCDRRAAIFLNNECHRWKRIPVRY